MNTRQFVAACILPMVLGAAGAAQASTIYLVNLDTSAINGGVGYGLAFQFQDGSASDDGNNTVTLSNFAFGGGSAAGGGMAFGGASGSLATSVVFNDTSFSNLYVEGFTPGSSLSFTMSLTTNMDAGGTPDLFGFSVLSGGDAIPTLDDLMADSFLYINIDSANPTPSVFGTDPDRSPNISIAAPTAEPTGGPVGVVPEPASLLLFGSGLVALAGMRRRRAARGRARSA